MDGPRGTDEVRDALLTAAACLYAAGGRFSVREVARRAGVNHGQIHHIFGGKPGLTRAMLSHLGAEQARSFEASDNPFDLLHQAADASASDGRFVRALARRLLESPGGTPLQDEFPVVERLRALVDEHGIEGGDVLLGEGLARALGWAFFGPWIEQAAGLDSAAVAEIQRRTGLPSVPIDDGSQ